MMFENNFLKALMTLDVDHITQKQVAAVKSKKLYYHRGTEWPKMDIQSPMRLNKYTVPCKNGISDAYLL